MEIEQEIARRFVGKEHVRDVAIHACGWVKRYTDELLAAGKSAVIPTDKFIAELTAFTRKIDRSDMALLEISDLSWKTRAGISGAVEKARRGFSEAAPCLIRSELHLKPAYFILSFMLAGASVW